MAERSATTSRAKKQTGRKRRVVGWVLLVVGVLAATAWFVSRHAAYGYTGRAWSTALAGGTCGLLFKEWDSPVGARATFSGTHPDALGYWEFIECMAESSSRPDGARNTDFGVAVYVDFRPDPFMTSYLRLQWFVIRLVPMSVACLIGGGVLLWSGRWARRRSLAGIECLKCGYALSGLGAGSLCPECGKQPVAG